MKTYVFYGQLLDIIVLPLEDERLGLDGPKTSVVVRIQRYVHEFNSGIDDIPLLNKSPRSVEVLEIGSVRAVVGRMEHQKKVYVLDRNRLILPDADGDEDTM